MHIHVYIILYNNNESFCTVLYRMYALNISHRRHLRAYVLHESYIARTAYGGLRVNLIKYAQMQKVEVVYSRNGMCSERPFRLPYSHFASVWLARFEDRACIRGYHAWLEVASNQHC